MASRGASLDHSDRYIDLNGTCLVRIVERTLSNLVNCSSWTHHSTGVPSAASVCRRAASSSFGRPFFDFAKKGCTGDGSITVLQGSATGPVLPGGKALGPTTLATGNGVHIGNVLAP